MLTTQEALLVSFLGMAITAIIVWAVLKAYK